MAHVEYRGGRWRVQIRRKWYPLPPGIRREQGDLAKAVGAGMSERMRRGEAVPSERGETVREWYGRWLKWREQRGDGDVQKIRGRFELYLAETLGPMAIATVRREHVKAVAVKLDALVKAGTISWKTAANVWSQGVSRAFKDAVDSKEPSLCVLTENPAANVRGPDKGAKTRKQYLYPDELLRLVGCEGVPLSRRRLYAFAAYTYMRAGEIAALDWEDVDVERGIIHVHASVDRVADADDVGSTKSGEARRVVVEPALRPMLEAMRAERRHGRVFVDMPPAHGSDGQAPTLRADLRRAGVQRAALTTRPATRTRKWMTFHDLRATGITWAAIRGDDAMKIMARSGHTQYQTMLGYVREAEVAREGFGEVFPSLPDLRTPSAPSAPGNPRILRETRRPQGDSKARRNAGEAPAIAAKSVEPPPESAPHEHAGPGLVRAALGLLVEAAVWDAFDAWSYDAERSSEVTS